MKTSDPVAEAIDAALAYIGPQVHKLPPGVCGPDCPDCVASIVHRQLIEAREAIESPGDERGSALLRVKVRRLEAELAKASADRARLTKERDALKAERPKPIIVPGASNVPRSNARAIPQWFLDDLREHPGSATAEIAHRTGHSEGSVSMALSTARRFVTGVRDPENRRRKVFSLRGDAPAISEKP